MCYTIGPRLIIFLWSEIMSHFKADGMCIARLFSEKWNNIHPTCAIRELVSLHLGQHGEDTSLNLC